jgi:hypothetical protein
MLDRTEGDSLNISTYVRKISVKKNYMENSLPLFVIDLNLPNDVKERMRDNDILINLEVTKYSDIDSEQTEETETPFITGSVFNVLIKPYTKPKNDHSFKGEEEEDETGKQDNFKLFAYQLAGVPEDLIKKNNIIVNEVYESSLIDDILVNILSKAESSKIFIDPSDNKDREDSLLVPPLNVITAIKYLNEYYGIYNSKLGLFFDYNGTYCFKHFNDMRSYTNSFEVVVDSVADIDDDVKYTTVHIDEEDKNVRIYLKTAPSMMDRKEIAMDSVGETSVFSSYDKNYNLVRRIYSNDTTNKKVRYFWNANSSKILEESSVNMAKYSNVVSIPLSNIDPNYFNVDTLFTIVSEKKFINGVYALLENTFSFTTKDYLHFESNIVLKLTKLK